MSSPFQSLHSYPPCPLLSLLLLLCPFASFLYFPSLLLRPLPFFSSIHSLLSVYSILFFFLYLLCSYLLLLFSHCSPTPSPLFHLFPFSLLFPSPFHLFSSLVYHPLPPLTAHFPSFLLPFPPSLFSTVLFFSSPLLSSFLFSSLPYPF